MLRITKASDPIDVKQIVVCIYAPPGVGKTSLGFTAESPLLLDFDAGSYRSQFRKDTVQVSSWADVEQITADDLAPYKTIVVDTAGRALDALTAQIIAQNPKMKGFGGALSLQGYGALKGSFVAWTKLIKSFGKDIVLLAHMDEQRSGDDVIERLDVQGGSKNEIYKAADAMGRLVIKGGARILNFDPSDAAFGKNPAAFAPLAVPNFNAEHGFLGKVIADIKAKLNEAGAEAVTERGRLEKLSSDLRGLETLDEFNHAVKEMAKASPKDKALLVSIGESKGFAFDKKAKTFIKAAA